MKKFLNADFTDFNVDCINKLNQLSSGPNDLERKCDLPKASKVNKGTRQTVFPGLVLLTAL
jgi:hypothetical protein